MKAYLVNAWLSQFNAGRISDFSVSRIACGDNTDEARSRCEAWLQGYNGGEKPTPTKIEKLVMAPVFDELFTEAGHTPIDWSQIATQVESATTATEADDFEQGYWADVNQLVHPARLSADLESLQHDLPEDIRSGLNWSSAKTFFFVVSILSPPPPPVREFAALEADPPTADAEEPSGAESRDLADTELRERQVAFLDLADRALAVLVQARNSVVAGWLWRRFAAKSGLAGNEIRIDPWCGVVTV